MFQSVESCRPINNTKKNASEWMNECEVKGYTKTFLCAVKMWFEPRTTDTQRELFFQKLEIFGLGQTNWAEILWGIWGISGQTISTILALWVPCPWENVAGSLSYKKLWFLVLKHITPKCSQNKILAIKNLEESLHTSVFGGLDQKAT